MSLLSLSTQYNTQHKLSQHGLCTELCSKGGTSFEIFTFHHQFFKGDINPKKLQMIYRELLKDDFQKGLGKFLASNLGLSASRASPLVLPAPGSLVLISIVSAGMKEISFSKGFPLTGQADVKWTGNGFRPAVHRRHH